MESRVLIVGSGPVGCYLAYLLAEAGIQVICIDRKIKPWIPLKCAGLVSDRFMEVVEVPKEAVLGKYNSFVLRLPNSEAEISGVEVAYVLDRIRFHEHLIGLAKRAGAEFSFGEELRTFGRRGNKWKCKTEKRVITAGLLIGADGANSKVRRGLGLTTKLMKGIQARARLRKEKIEVILDKRLSDFFSWIIPESDGICRVGMLGFCVSLQKLKRLLSELNVSEVIDYQAGMIPYGILKRMSSERLLLVGDAASQVKASTGGGLVTGFLGAKIAFNCVLNGDLSERALAENYDGAYLASLGKELKLSYYCSLLLRKLDNEDLSRLSGVLERAEVREIIYNYGDMELYSKFAKKFLLKSLGALFPVLFKHPSLMFVLSSIFIA